MRFSISFVSLKLLRQPQEPVCLGRYGRHVLGTPVVHRTVWRFFRASEAKVFNCTCLLRDPLLPILSGRSRLSEPAADLDVWDDLMRSPHVEGSGNDDDQALDDDLKLDWKTNHQHRVKHHDEDGSPHETTDDRTGSTRQRDAAHHSGHDRVELEAAAHPVIDDADETG